jgi:DsrE/DsrF/DsrH-like protein
MTITAEGGQRGGGRGVRATVRILSDGRLELKLPPHQGRPEGPSGFYNIELIVNGVVRSKGHVDLCGSCMAARAIAATEIIDGAQRSSMEEPARWTQWADKVMVFLM